MVLLIGRTPGASLGSDLERRYGAIASSIKKQLKLKETSEIFPVQQSWKGVDNECSKKDRDKERM